MDAAAAAAAAALIDVAPQRKATTIEAAQRGSLARVALTRSIAMRHDGIIIIGRLDDRFRDIKCLDIESDSARTRAKSIGGWTARNLQRGWPKRALWIIQSAANLAARALARLLSMIDDCARSVFFERSKLGLAHKSMSGSTRTLAHAMGASMERSCARQQTHSVAAPIN